MQTKDHGKLNLEIFTKNKKSKLENEKFPINNLVDSLYSHSIQIQGITTKDFSHFDWKNKKYLTYDISYAGLKWHQQEGPTIITILSFPFPFMSCKQISMAPRAIKEKALYLFTRMGQWDTSIHSLKLCNWHKCWNRPTKKHKCKWCNVQNLPRPRVHTKMKYLLISIRYWTNKWTFYYFKIINADQFNPLNL